MKRRGIIILMAIVCVVAFCLVGCKRHKDLAMAAGSVESSDTRTGNRTDNDGREHETSGLETITGVECESYSANFSCTIDGIALNGQIRILKDSVIWVSLSKIIEIGRAKFTPTHVSAYVKLVNKSYDGDYEGIRKNWGVDIDFATMQSLMFGTMPPNCEKSREPQLSGDTVTLCWNQAVGQGRRVTMKKDCRKRTLNEMTIVSPAAKAQLECRYLERGKVQGQLVPTLLKVVAKSKGFNKGTTVRLDKIELNGKLSFPFKMPNFASY